jgi:hypothetical protein
MEFIVPLNESGATTIFLSILLLPSLFNILI